MGPEPPPKTPRGPAWFRKLIDAIRDYAVANHIESIEVRQSADFVLPKFLLKPQPSGTLGELQLPQGAGGGGGSVDVTTVNSADIFTAVDEVDNISRLSFVTWDPDGSLTRLTLVDNGGGEALLKFPTIELATTLSGVPKTVVLLYDGIAPQDI